MMYDLMDDEPELTATELRKRADRVLFLHEFAVAYEEPIETDPGRGYLTIWVTLDHTDATNPSYDREYAMSGDDGMIRTHLASYAKFPSKIETTLDATEEDDG